VRISLTALLLLVAQSAAAQCRIATPEDTPITAAWTVHTGDVAVGRCGPHRTWCFFAAGNVCETTLIADEVAPSTVTVNGARVLVLHWSSHSMSEDHVFRDGSGTELWRIDRSPSRILTVLERWSEGDANPVRSEPRTTCGAGRTIEVTPEHVVLGAREPFGDCHVPATDRRGRIGIGPGARTFTWSELLSPAPGARH
jgi:hypothetical protein